MPDVRRARIVLPVLAAAALAATLATARHAEAGQASWAAPQIRAVTQAGVLGTSPATFHAAAPLTQSALEAAIAATAKLQAPPAPPPAPPATVEIDSSIGNAAVVAGVVPWEIAVPNQAVERVDFAVDGTGLASAVQAPYLFDLGAGGLDTTKLPDGPHTLAVKATFTDGGLAIAVWPFTVANAPGSTVTGPTAPSAVPVVKQSLPTPPPAAAPVAPARSLYRAASPTRAVTIRQLDAALVGYLSLGGAARDSGAAPRRRPEPAGEHRNGGGRTHARAPSQPSGGTGQPRAAAGPGSHARRGCLVVRPDADDRQRRGRAGAAGRRRPCDPRLHDPGSGGS